MFRTVIGEFCRDQQIAPVFLREIDHLVKPIEIAIARFQSGKLKPFELLGVIIFEEGQIVAAFLKEQARHWFALLRREEQRDAAEGFGAECGSLQAKSDVRAEPHGERAGIGVKTQRLCDADGGAVGFERAILR